MATISEAFALAIQHHQGGRLQAAEQVYRQILAVEPNHAQAIHLLGVIAHQAGKHDVAVQYITRAIRLQAGTASFHNNLGEAYRALGKISEAVACYRRAVELKPDFAAAHSNLGVALRDRGEAEEAVACWRRALELDPDLAEVHSNLGNVLKNQGRLNEAVACCRRAVELKPGLAEAHGNLGNALKDQGKLEEALACCRRAVELKPDIAEAHNNLGVALKEQGKLEEALACYRRALELKPDYAEAHNNLGVALKDQGNLEEALACCHRALELKPDLAEAHGSLGNVLEEIGDLQGAEDSFRAALRHDSRFAFAHYKLADLLRGKLPEEDLVAQRRLLRGTRAAGRGSASGEPSELTGAQRLLHFGLAQVLDARGEYAEAAKHLDRGNALQLSDWRKRGQEYDPKAYELLVNQMIAVCTPDFFERVGGFGLESEIPVFVVGLPRSGTTLVEQILASHSQVCGAGEIQLASDTMAALGGQTVRQALSIDSFEGLRRLDAQTVRRLASRHLEKLRAFSPAALCIVDKTLGNYLYLGLLASLFPRAKFIHCRRDLRDVAVSCWMTHFQDIRWANDHQHIASRFCEHQRIMEHWRKVLPVPLLEVDYAETVADLEGVARKLVAWCGLQWEPKCLDFHQAQRPVRTASAVQVRQPLYTTSVGRWRHYEQSLSTLLSALPGGQ